MTAILRAIAKHPSGRIGAAIIVVYILAAVLGALHLTPHDPIQQFRIDRLKGPNGTYWMGTDLLGRDTMSRLMLGDARALPSRSRPSPWPRLQAPSSVSWLRGGGICGMVF